VSDLPNAGDEIGVRERDALIPLLDAKDLVDFGMIPEFVGRLPVLVPMRSLQREEVLQVMTEPKNALVKQYRRLFEMEGADIEFTPEALLEIAKRAKAKDTGARGLRSIVEHVMVDIMYELPDQPKGSKFVIDQDVVVGRKPMFPMQEPMQKSA
jgi:ATP-dependent Clp protease ATP-binding subunit ClpX